MDRRGKMVEAKNAASAIAPHTPEKLKESTSYKRGRKYKVSSNLHSDLGKRKALSECITSLKSQALSFDERCKSAAYHTRHMYRIVNDIFTDLEAAENGSPSKRTRKKNYELTQKIPRMVLVEGGIREWRKILEDESNLKEERKLMSLRVSRFIKNMQRVQGDRHYSRWKGSVLDSVVGAFLSQNTADQLSSSTFMSLAACFPPKQDMILENREEENGCSRVVDCVDWDAVRQARTKDISKVIMLRGMNKRLAQRIKALLNWLDGEHNSLDIEFLRTVGPEIIMKFLTKFEGIGVKTVECVRLLALNQLAFPVDVNVARVMVRLGWVPIPLIQDESPTYIWDKYGRVPKHIHQYLWLRLQGLRHETLYQLHCQMITFGKVFCTTNDPNCNECPIRGNCNHYRSKVTSEKKKIEKHKSSVTDSPTIQCPDIEDICYNSGRKKPKVDVPSTSPNKLTKVDKRRTKHIAYELPDDHPLLDDMNGREDEDSKPYLLVAWEPGKISTNGRTLNKSVPGTIMIPCRTAVGGSFPLNGTHFQINEVFADHETSECPVLVSRRSLSRLPKKVLYCGSQLTTIVKGLSADEIRLCFNEGLSDELLHFHDFCQHEKCSNSPPWPNGYICTRGFDRKSGLPSHLHERLHPQPKPSKRPA